MMCTVHMEGGWDSEGVNICRAEVYCPHGGRVGQRGGQHLQSRGVLSTWREGGTERGEHPQR